MKVAKLALMVALTGVSGAALADDFFAPGSMTPMDYSNNTRVITNGAINKAVSRDAFYGGKGSSTRSSPMAPAAAGKALSGLAIGSAALPAGAQAATFPYTASRADQQQAKDEFLARLMKKDPKAAATATPQLQNNDIDQIFANLADGTGLSPNDAADVMTGYIVLGWMIANGQMKDPTPAAYKSARTQVAALLSQNGALNDPATRIKAAEEVKILTVVLHSGWQSSRKEGNTPQYADGVANYFRSNQSDDLRNLKLTDSGFQKL